MAIKVRVVIEYVSEETMEYERKAWHNGEVTFTDFAVLALPVRLVNKKSEEFGPEDQKLLAALYGDEVAITIDEVPLDPPTQGA